MQVRFLVVLALLASGCGHSTCSANIRRIEISPWPEGPRLIASTDTAGGRALLAKVEKAIPGAFPPNRAQQCHLGTTIRIQLGQETYAFGPCQIPKAIEKLRQMLIAAAISQQGLANEPARTVTRAEWQAVFKDWYDGKMDHWHSCAAVREAIRHLPADGVVYSTIGLDLDSYARGVC
jgi:hypothetical protein